MNTLNKILYNWSSLTASLWCLGIYFILVLVGTFAQIDHGIFYVQNIYFNSFFIYKTIGSFTIPIFPGGALVGLALVINLILSTILRIKWNWRKSGILLVHLGLIILLLGGGMTSCINQESQIYLKENDSTFYSEDLHKTELAIIDATNQNFDITITIPTTLLKSNKVITTPELPFDIKVHNYFANSQLFEKKSAGPPLVYQGIGQHLNIKEIPIFTKDELKNNEAFIISFKDETSTYDTMLVALDINGTQLFIHNDKPYYLQLRPKRYYFPFMMTLKKFTEELYPNSTIPKSYSSLVELTDFKTWQKRDVLIYMNHPLRHQFFTFFQASFGQDEPSSVLQVVYSPIWTLPYISCLIISIGMLVHFLMYFIKPKKTK